jgi:hypothetical protein
MVNQLPTDEPSSAARYAASRSTCTTTMSTRGARQAANSIVQSFAQTMRTRKLVLHIAGGHESLRSMRREIGLIGIAGTPASFVR